MGLGPLFSPLFRFEPPVTNALVMVISGRVRTTTDIPIAILHRARRIVEPPLPIRVRRNQTLFVGVRRRSRRGSGSLSLEVRASVTGCGMYRPSLPFTFLLERVVLLLQPNCELVEEHRRATLRTLPLFVQGAIQLTEKGVDMLLAKFRFSAEFRKNSDRSGRFRPSSTEMRFGSANYSATFARRLFTRGADQPTFKLRAATGLIGGGLSIIFYCCGALGDVF